MVVSGHGAVCSRVVTVAELMKKKYKVRLVHMPVLAHTGLSTGLAAILSCTVKPL